MAVSDIIEQGRKNLKFLRTNFRTPWYTRAPRKSVHLMRLFSETVLYIVYLK